MEAAGYFGQKLPCPPVNTKVVPACEVKKCGVFGVVPLYPFPGNKYGAGANVLPFTGGRIIEGGSYGSSEEQIGDEYWCRVELSIGQIVGWSPRKEFIPIDQLR